MESILTWVNAISALFTALGVVFGIYVFYTQTNISLFIEYTKRYSEVMSNLSIETRLNPEKEPKDSPEDLTRAALGYFNLAAEEFYLKKKHYLSRKVWSIWEADLRRTIAWPLFRKEWKKLRSEYSCFPEFQLFVDDIHRKLNAPI